MPVSVYLLRHGSTGADGRFIGSTDLPLSERGREQVEHIQPLIEKLRFDTVFCSPMTRCVQTLEHLNLDARIEMIENLKEVHFGKWENLSYEEVSRSHPDSILDWQHNPTTFRFPDGESLVAFTNRLESVKQKITDQIHDKLLIICHGGVIRILICLLLQIPLTSSMLFNIQPGCCTRIDLYDQGGVLSGLNLGGTIL